MTLFTTLVTVWSTCVVQPRIPATSRFQLERRLSARGAKPRLKPQQAVQSQLTRAPVFAAVGAQKLREQLATAFPLERPFAYVFGHLVSGRLFVQADAKSVSH